MYTSSNMGAKFISWILFFPLLVILCSYGGRGREFAGTENKFLEIVLEEVDNVNTDIQDISGLSQLISAMDEPNKLEEKDHQTVHTEHTHAHFMTHMNHIDPSVMVFFTLKDLKVGKRMPVYFPKRDPITSPKLWPREEADSVPFSLHQLPYLLKLFSFGSDSPQAIAMENTLRECESKPIKGEVKFCATSFESMLDFTHSIIGLTSDLQSFATFHQTKSSVNFQNYTILEILMEVPAPKMVACHTMPYPYSVFYCHSQESENRVYKVSLAGDNADRVEAMVVCHMDTSQWTPNHVSFHVLGVTPGSSSVCHFFPADNLIWFPKLQAHGSSSM